MMAKPPDVLVIGAGVIGLASAFRLASDGHRVLLLDRDPPAPGSGASFGNAGHIATEQIFPLASIEVVRGALRYLLDAQSPLRIRPAYLLSIVPWLLRFAWAARPSAFERGVNGLAALQKTAREDWVGLLHDAHASHLMHMNGHLVLVESPRSLAAARKEIARLAAFGIETEWLSAAATKEIAPEITANIEGAWKFNGTGHVDDPRAVCKALHDAFLGAGGQFVQTKVATIASVAGGFRAETSSGVQHSAKHLVLC